MTKIEWTDVTWNPVTGCSKVSEGCRNCYAERMSHRFGWTEKPWNDQYTVENVKLHPERLEQPLKWKKPRMVFVNSMSDLFHEEVPFEFISKVFHTMWLADEHIFQILTKRPKRMLEYFSRLGANPLPLPNVWVGVSVENQEAANERIPLLLETPAAVRFLSCEPLLGPVDLSMFLENRIDVTDEVLPLIDWIIVGGESGPNARTMHPDWVRSLRDQCQEAGVAFFFKQWGEYYPEAIEGLPDGIGKPGDIQMHTTIDSIVQSQVGVTYPVAFDSNGKAFKLRKVGKKKAGRLLDGREWNEMPSMAFAK